MARSDTASISGWRTASTCSSAWRATDLTPGTAATCAAIRAQSAALAGAASGTCSTRTGAESDNRRERSSVSNPFITDRMTIRAATPTATPTRETQVMNETKNRCERARA